MRPQLLNLRALAQRLRGGHSAITARYLARRVWSQLISHNAREAQQNAAVGPETVDPFPLQVDSGPILVEIGEAAWRQLDAPPEILEQQILQRLAQIQTANSRRFSWVHGAPPTSLEIHLVADDPSPTVRVITGTEHQTSLSSSPVVGRIYDENDVLLAEIRPPLTQIPLFDDLAPVDVLSDAHGAIIFTSKNDVILFRELGARNPVTRLQARGSCVLDLAPPSGEPRRVSFRVHPQRPVVVTSTAGSRQSAQSASTSFRGWRLGRAEGRFDLSFGPPGSGVDVEAALKHLTKLTLASTVSGAEVILTEGRASLGARALEHGQTVCCTEGASIYVEGRLKLLLTRGNRGIEVCFAEPVRVFPVAEGLEPEGPCCWHLIRIRGLRRLATDGFLEAVSRPKESAK